MTTDVVELVGFYRTPLGGVAARLIGRVLNRMWPDVAGLRVAGLGFAPPLLPDLTSGAERVLALMPAAQGAITWPEAGRCATTLADPLCLPFPEASLDRVLVVHALETSESPGDLLGEVSRVLAPAGQAILVCPNRRGLWARMDTTPFGQGQPFSRKQLRILLRDTDLVPEAWAETLYMPPFASPLAVRGAALWERVGGGLSLPFAGLHVVLAVKQPKWAVPLRVRRRSPARRPVLFPVPAS